MRELQPHLDLHLEGLEGGGWKSVSVFLPVSAGAGSGRAIAPILAIILYWYIRDARVEEECSNGVTQMILIFLRSCGFHYIRVCLCLPQYVPIDVGACCGACCRVLFSLSSPSFVEILRVFLWLRWAGSLFYVFLWVCCPFHTRVSHWHNLIL